MPYTHISGAGIGKFRTDFILDTIQSWKPGGWVRGELELCVEKKVQSIGIIVAFMGVAAVQLGRSNSATRIFQAHCYVHNKDMTDKHDISIQPGDYKYPFYFRLPENIPASFISHYARVTYELGAFLRCVRSDMRVRAFRCKFLQINSRKINIEQYLNIRCDESLFCPRQVEISKKKSFSLFSGKNNDRKFKCILDVPKTGFICGETLNFNVEIENITTLHLQDIEASLIRKTVYNSEGMVKTTSQVITLVTLEVEDQKSEDEMNWSGKYLLPSNLIPTFKAGRVHGGSGPSHEIINLFYILRVVIYASHALGGAPNLSGEIPITIGTVDDANSIRDSDANGFEEDFSDTWSLAAESGHEVDRSMLPSYSQLSLRSSFGRSRASLCSIETLPPSYEFAMRMGSVTP